jgi:hypothetical protein
MSGSGHSNLQQRSDLQTLVAQCLTGDQAAMLALVERFRGQVFGLCYRMLGPAAGMPEDARQETVCPRPQEPAPLGPGTRF